MGCIVGWLICLLHAPGIYDWFLNCDLPVIGKLRLSKMPLKHSNLYLCGTLTEDMVQFLVIAPCISAMLAWIVRQGELFPGEIFLAKICVSISVLLNIAVSVKLTTVFVGYDAVISVIYFLAMVRRWKVMTVGRRLIGVSNGGNLDATSTVNQILITSCQW